MGLSRQEYWSGWVAIPSSGGPPDPGMEPGLQPAARVSPCANTQARTLPLSPAPPSLGVCPASLGLSLGPSLLSWKEKGCGPERAPGGDWRGRPAVRLVCVCCLGSPKDASCPQSPGLLVGLKRGHSWRWGGRWSCRDVLSVRETLVGALLVILGVSWALTGAEVMPLVPAPAHTHLGE